MQFVAHTGKLLIAPTAGYTPHIGVLVAAMQRCRDTTIRLVQDLTIAQLDYLFDDQDNSIGALLLHLAAIEAAYQEYTFTGHNILDNPERIAKWVVSSSFRGVAPVMFGIIADDNQVKDHQATDVVGKGPHFVRFGAKLAEEAFQQVG